MLLSSIVCPLFRLYNALVLNQVLIRDGTGNKTKRSSEYYQYWAFRNQSVTILIKREGHDIFLFPTSMNVTQHILFSAKLILTNSESQVLQTWGLIGSDFCLEK